MNFKEEKIETKGINVRKLGAKGDGKKDDSVFIQKALDSDYELIVIPEGIYKIKSTLKVDSNKHIRAHPQAKIILGNKAAKYKNDFLLTNKNHKTGNSNIVIEGGIWDGNNKNNPRGGDESRGYVKANEAEEDNQYTGVMMNFFNVDNLKLKSLVLTNPEAYYSRFCKVSNFHIEDIEFECDSFRPNQDGVHFGGYCKNGVIRDIKAEGSSITNDDLVALNADDVNTRAQNLGKLNGPIENIRIENIRADDCHSFVRLLSVFSPIKNISIKGIKGGFRNNVLNMDAARYCRVPVVDENSKEFNSPLGEIKDINIEEVEVYVTKEDSNFIRMETRVDNFNIYNFQRNRNTEIESEGSTINLKYLTPGELEIYGLDKSQVELLCENSTCINKEYKKLAGFNNENKYYVKLEIDKNSTVNLKKGGFERLSFNEF
ncbi:MAG: glycosyl hydrolase family 28-related protein [bacterium]